MEGFDRPPSDVYSCFGGFVFDEGGSFGEIEPLPNSIELYEHSEFPDCTESEIRP